MSQPETLITSAGVLIYGPVWQAVMAERLGVPKRTVQRWAAGSAPVPRGVWTELRTDLLEKGRSMQDLNGLLLAAADGRFASAPLPENT